jgi:hypothetical protein
LIRRVINVIVNAVVVAIIVAIGRQKVNDVSRMTHRCLSACRDKRAPHDEVVPPVEARAREVVVERVDLKAFERVEVVFGPLPSISHDVKVTPRSGGQRVHGRAGPKSKVAVGSQGSGFSIRGVCGSWVGEMFSRAPQHAVYRLFSAILIRGGGVIGGSE